MLENIACRLTDRAMRIRSQWHRVDRAVAAERNLEQQTGTTPESVRKMLGTGAVALFICALAVAVADVPALVTELKSIRSELVAAGVDSSREDSTLFTAALFEAAIASDANNSDLPAVFAGWMSCRPDNATCAALAKAKADELPGLETSELEVALYAAIAEAKAVLVSPRTRLPSPAFNASELVLSNGYWRNGVGTPRFATGFNSIPPASISSGPNGSQAAYTIGFTDFSIGIYWCLQANGSVPAYVISDLAAALTAAVAGGYKIEMFVDHSQAPPWALKEWPDIANCTNVRLPAFCPPPYPVPF